MEQPTNDELHKAWTNAIHAVDIPGARAEARQELQRLRDLRSTWFGAGEWKFRCALDAFLSGKGDYPMEDRRAPLQTEGE